MYHVRRLHDAGGGHVEFGPVETVEELHELLRESYGVFVVSAEKDRPGVRLELEAPIGDDRAFVDLVALAVRTGSPPGPLVTTRG